MAQAILPTPPIASPQQPTCLFTGEVLNASTKDEHTIPESLGGRIVSKTVSSTRFNEESSKTIDLVLAQAYAPLFNRLGPLVPKHTQPGAVTVRVPDADDGRYVFESGGVLSLKNVRVVERYPNGRPKALEAADEDALRLIAKRMGVDPTKMVFTERLTTNQHMAFADFVPVAREIELGQLKAVLLTFDAVLGASAHNFTRHASLHPVREMLRRAVIDRKPPTFEEMNRFVLGLQYDKVDRIRRLREASRLPRTPFEHVLVASGNAGTRTLDAAWLVFDSDPIAFRLCSDWRGPGFTYVIVSAVVRDGETYGPYWHFGDGLLLPYSDLRSHPSLYGPNEDAVKAHMQKAVERVSMERRAAYQAAVDYVERHCDEFVRENLALLTRLGGGEGTGPRPIARGVETRLQRMFHERLKENADLQRVLEEVIARQLKAMPDSVREETIATDDKEANHVTWPAWLAAERAMLDDVRESIGLPGDVITRSVTAVTEIPGTRPIGMPPPPP